jgi:type II secretory pathway pseudopilin PulG
MADSKIPVERPYRQVDSIEFCVDSAEMKFRRISATGLSGSQQRDKNCSLTNMTGTINLTGDCLMLQSSIRAILAFGIRRIDAVIAICVVLVLVLLLIPAVYQARNSARQSILKHKLQSLGLALQTYHEAHQVFPPGGTFDGNDVAHHSWTTFMDPYVAQSAFYNIVDSNVPWDDPRNVDLFLNGPLFVNVWQSMDVEPTISSDGFHLSHLAANERLLYRNSSVSIKDLDGNSSSIVLVGEVHGNFDLLGHPYNWRDLTAGLRTPTGFGSPSRNETSFVMCDGSVRIVQNTTDSRVVAQLAGPNTLRPDPRLVSRPDQLYRLKSDVRWLYSHRVRGHKTLMEFKLSPDGSELFVNFADYDDPQEAVASKWLSSFRTLTQNASVQHVTLKGRMRANELIPFLEIPTLKRLTISDARITDDKDGTLATARPSIEID